MEYQPQKSLKFEIRLNVLDQDQEVHVKLVTITFKVVIRLKHSTRLNPTSKEAMLLTEKKFKHTVPWVIY